MRLCIILVFLLLGCSEPVEQEEIAPKPIEVEPCLPAICQSSQERPDGCFCNPKIEHRYYPHG